MLPLYIYFLNFLRPQVIKVSKQYRICHEFELEIPECAVHTYIE
jgi:hypothetical protein